MSLTLPPDSVLANPRVPFPPKRPTFIGDRFVLVYWSIVCGAIVLDSSDSLNKLLSNLDDHCTSEESTLSVCEVAAGLWIDNGPDGYEPLALRTLYQIQHYADPSEDEE